MNEYIALMQAINSPLFVICGFFIVREIKSFKSNQKELFDRMHTLEKELYTLQGEHKTQHKAGA